VKKGAFIGIGAGCFVVVFAVAVLALGGSSLSLNQNEIPASGIQEIQSEFNYIKTLPRTEESLETIIEPLLKEMMERPSVINTCSKIYDKSLEGTLEMSKLLQDNDLIGNEQNLEWAVENSPIMVELYENEEVFGWCVSSVQLFGDKFPDVMSNEEFMQKVAELQD